MGFRSGASGCVVVACRGGRIEREQRRTPEPREVWVTFREGGNPPDYPSRVGSSFSQRRHPYRMADTSNKPASVFSTSTTLSLLSETAAAAYLERIQLPASLLSASPSLELLAQLQLASLLNVPFDTTILHVPGSAWNGDPLAPVVLGAGDAMPLGQGAFDQIVRDHRGEHCCIPYVRLR